MDDKVLISIIVPTRNRAEYALSAVKQILSIENDSIQAVIQDNSNDKSLEKMLIPYSGDKRLKYNYSPEILSFVDNFGIAVSLADGEYICIIGDDDGVNPEIVQLAKWASNNNVKAVKPEVQAVYFWPDAISHSEKISMNNGCLTVSEISKEVRVADTSVEINKLLKNGFQGYLSLDLVKLYHGLVKKECMNEIQKLTGAYFGGLSPDIYSAVALSILIPEVICIDYPITIPGICNKSGSADSATGRHTGELKDAPHLVGHKNYEWAKQIPSFYSVETIWADSSIAALKDMRIGCLLKKFRLEALSVPCIKKYPQYKELIIDHFIENNIGIMKVYKKMRLHLAKGYIPIMSIFERGLKRLKKGRKNIVKFYNISNISEAQKIFSEHLFSTELNIRKVIDNIVDALRI